MAYVDAVISHASEGNFLEAINLAVNGQRLSVLLSKQHNTILFINYYLFFHSLREKFPELHLPIDRAADSAGDTRGGGV